MEQNKQNNFKKFGLVGKNINYSFSKKYFNNKFIKEKISNCRYENFDIISIEKIKRILEIKDLVGLNVTIPYKESIIPYIDKISEKAKKIGINAQKRVLKDHTYFNRAKLILDIILKIKAMLIFLRLLILLIFIL